MLKALPQLCKRWQKLEREDWVAESHGNSEEIQGCSFHESSPPVGGLFSDAAAFESSMLSQVARFLESYKEVQYNHWFPKLDVNVLCGMNTCMLISPQEKPHSMTKKAINHIQSVWHKPTHYQNYWSIQVKHYTKPVISIAKRSYSCVLMYSV